MTGSVFGLFALLPALFLATVVGGNFGGGYGGILSEAIGLGELGIPIGLAMGLVIVTVVTVTTILIIGAGLGALLVRSFCRGSEN